MEFKIGDRVQIPGKRVAVVDGVYLVDGKQSHIVTHEGEQVSVWETTHLCPTCGTPMKAIGI